MCLFLRFNKLTPFRVVVLCQRVTIIRDSGFSLERERGINLILKRSFCTVSSYICNQVSIIK
jgi:hypothetical protein